MNWFNNLKVRTKLLSGFILVTIVAGAIGLLGMIDIGKVNNMLNDMYNNNLVPIEDIANANSEAIHHNRDVFEFVLETQKAEMDKFREAMDKKEAKMKEHLNKYRKTHLTDKEKIIIDKFDAAWPAYISAAKKVLSLADAGKNRDAIEVARGEMIKEFQVADDLLTELVNLNQSIAKEAYDHSGVIVARINKVILVFIIVSLILGVSIALFITTDLMRQLGGEPGYIADIAKNISEGNLTVKMESRGKEVGVFAAMKNMTERLKGIVADVKSTADNVASASQQLSASSEQMSRGTLEQSGRASQIATSSSEMSQTVVDIARNASNIASAATDATKTAQDGGVIVSKSVDEVKAIADTVSETAKMVSSLGERSKQIGEIVSVINDIADQTNLLALNAAIEAARAGEQGRGFAVVADEVRKLAERTAKATSEIGDMIKAIQDEVEKAVASMNDGTERVNIGVELSTQAGKALHGIVKSVDELHCMVQQIASATEEMSTVSETISGDIETIASVSKETSTSSEQIAQASNDLARLASNLQGIVGQFKV